MKDRSAAALICTISQLAFAALFGWTLGGILFHQSYDYGYLLMSIVGWVVSRYAVKATVELDCLDSD